MTSDARGPTLPQAAHLRMGGMVEEARATRRRAEQPARGLAQRVSRPTTRRQIELTWREACGILALPPAGRGRLRFITRRLKINKDLERIGGLDLANVAAARDRHFSRARRARCR